MKSQGEPVVESNGDQIRFVQAEDGFWYAYIASTWAVGNATTDDGNIDFRYCWCNGSNPL